MSEKTYTAAEVERMLAEQKAILEAKSAKAFRCYVKSGTFKPTSGSKKGTDVAFSHIAIEGDFYPQRLSFKAAKALLSNIALLKAAVAESEKPVVVSEPALANDTTPRIAK